ncbi:uncharacterized protein LY79DRAFT_97488 [Colletotrichum navitas]|uniref:Uncharacterized protein n=1 Tax=Colletotrichum navitas TaxID=681940 RepID=A0AAD8PLD2_9PEZI|nr:uncharacterized protein LY79DRAFT_97488 [Colletotrichum navitas]KAK1566320.1 hypothetical protein LY79DRAFT_97488 [Colletotrichum navitas]
MNSIGFCSAFASGILTRIIRGGASVKSCTDKARKPWCKPHLFITRSRCQKEFGEFGGPRRSNPTAGNLDDPPDFAIASGLEAAPSTQYLSWWDGRLDGSSSPTPRILCCRGETRRAMHWWHGVRIATQIRLNAAPGTAYYCSLMEGIASNSLEMLNTRLSTSVQSIN